ncbi:aspartyl-tRNA amidotransferase subunit B [Kordiimonas sediminis]|uniref:Aspartyl-tRNA amidotransferase subunit B n=1 Tax=Kordiimonas sediminis TaxID=1735581 RepID=A0A919APG8_9PROT|nr:GatB/YqeY domain-containing protein [Kordiimonas sediminis]GHF19105.1 aspartyl-tRNA amidotransferase subunit B [Kordiimonas sediminis]
MLRDDLTQSMKEAMRSKDSRRLSTVRLILAAVKEKDIELRTQDDSDRDDDAIITDILAKMVKQRKDSIQAYEEAGRCELAEREREEIEIIQDFLPTQMTDDEIKAACEAVVSELGAEGLKDIGRCMGVLKTKYAGQMDMAKASGMIKAMLS